jgi:hypothetical protein
MYYRILGNISNRYYYRDLPTEIAAMTGPHITVNISLLQVTIMSLHSLVLISVAYLALRNNDCQVFATL